MLNLEDVFPPKKTGDCCVVVLPVAAVGERSDDQTRSVAQILITIRQTCIDHLSLEVVLLHRVQKSFIEHLL